MKNAFSSNKSRIAECFKHNSVTRLIVSKKRFQVLQNFLSDLHASNENEKHSCIRKVLFYSYKNATHPIYKCISDNKVDNLKRVLKLYTEYKRNWEEIQLIFMFKQLHQSFFKEMTVDTFRTATDFLKQTFASNKETLADMIYADLHNNSLDFLEDAEKFTFFETFLLEFFVEEKDTAVDIIRKCLFHSKNLIWHLILRTAEHKSANNLQILNDAFETYAKSTEELQDHFVSHNIPRLMFETYMNQELYRNFENFNVTIFKSNHEKLLDVFDSGFLVKLRKDSEIFWRFEKFLSKLFDGDENQVSEFIRKILLMSPIPIDSSTTLYELELIEILYADFIKSYLTELQDVVISFDNPLELLHSMTGPIFEAFCNFLVKTFESNKDRIIECFSDLELTKYISDKTKFLFFEKLLNNFFETDQSRVDKCLKNILFKKFENEFHPLLYSLEIFEVEEFKRVLELYITYASSAEEVQEVFKSHKIVLGIFSHMSPKIYPKFKEFMLTNFESNFDLLVERMDGDGGFGIAVKEERFKIFEDFLGTFMDAQNKREIITKILFQNYDSDDHPLVQIISKSDPDSFDWITRLYSEYSESCEKIQELFVSNQILLPIFSKMTKKVYPKFLKFLTETFNLNNEKLLECLDDNCDFDVIRNEKKFNFFDDFATKLFSETQKHEAMRKVLFCDYQNNCHPLIEIVIDNDIESFERVKKLYIQYSNSQSEVQNILMSTKYLGMSC